MLPSATWRYLQVEVTELASLDSVIQQLREGEWPGLVHIRCSRRRIMMITGDDDGYHPRVPTCNSAAPTEADFDLMSRALTGTRSANIF